MDIERQNQHIQSLDDLLEAVATEFRSGHMDEAKWQIVGEYNGRTGLLYYVDCAGGGGDPEFLAKRIMALMNEQGGRVEAWPPRKDKAA